ncbi:hypothetical protein JZ785_16450 [Alicyclobacillus curvatus]|nr:hypothetical protein JZ785_16450 [Alicyclobacillus curvatus]
MDRFLNNNLVLRIVAVILACILWFTVNAPQPSSSPGQSAFTAKDFPYAVQVTVAPDMMVTSIDHPTVVIEVKGSLVDTNSLPSQMMGVQVDADGRGLGPGTHTLVLKAANMPAVQYSIIPQAIQVTLEKKVTASKPVRIQVTGTPATGYQVGKVQPDVQTVQVSGVSSAVERVVAVTADISVQAAKTTVSHTLTLEPIDKNGRPVAGVEVDPVNVTTVVRIEPPQVAVKIMPEVVGTPAPGYAISGLGLTQSSVNVTAPPDVTANLSTMSLPVDVSRLSATQTLNIPIVPQAGWSRVQPNSVQVTVQVEKSAARTFKGVPVQVVNMPQGLSVSLGSTHTLDIRVSGPVSIVSQLRTSDLVAYIDASNLTTGSTSAPVSVSVPNWVSVTQLSQNRFPVSVTQAGANTTSNAAGNSTTGNASGNAAANAAGALNQTTTTSNQVQ